MAAKFFVCALLALFATSCYGGVVPVAPAAYVAPYASSYSASVVNHAVAAPVAAAPLVAAAPAPLAAAPLVAAAPAPLAAAPFAAAPLAYSAYNPYPAFPAAPLIAGRR